MQGVVMIPTKEMKMLTYQLMENHFLHLQELKKTLASNAPSKTFYLFYVNMDQVIASSMFCTIFNDNYQGGQTLRHTVPEGNVQHWSQGGT